MQPGIIGDLKSYWAMHFCAVLETLYEHKGLEYSFQRSIPVDQPKTLASLNAYTEQGFLARMRKNVHNWGLQYFLCHYLMSREGSPVLYAILDEISNNYDFDLRRNMSSYGVFVCGVDSYSGEQFLRTTSAAIFGYDERTILNAYKDIKWVDLCILIARFKGDILDTAILGEVEGNKFDPLLRNSFWRRKASFCSFGIGVQLASSNIGIQNIKTESGIKTVVSLGSEFDVIEDFKISIGIMEAFFSISPAHRLQFVPGQREVVDIVREHWGKSIEDLIMLLRGMVQRLDVASMGTNTLSLNTVPKIVITF